MLKQIPIHWISNRTGVVAQLTDVPDGYTDRCVHDRAILEPSFCRKTGESPDHYELISNSRPWLAAQICQYDSIPVFVLTHDYDDYQPYIDGTSMNPIEVAELNLKLKEEQGLTVSELARRLGVNRSALAHSLRLLNLAETIKNSVRDGTITAGYARRFASFNRETQIELFRRFTSSNSQMSVRALERALRDIKNGQSTPPEEQLSPKKDPSIVQLERLMTESIGSRVELHQDHLTINFGGNLDVFDGILQKFGISSSSY